MEGSVFVFALLFYLAYGFFLLRRNNWVRDQCLRVLREQGIDEFYRLPSYDFMLYARPWIWDIEKFKQPSS